MSHYAPRPKPNDCGTGAHGAAPGPVGRPLGLSRCVPGLVAAGMWQRWLCCLAPAPAPVRCPAIPPAVSKRPLSPLRGSGSPSPAGPPCPVFLRHLSACAEPVNHTVGGRGPCRGPEVPLGLGACRAAPGVRTAVGMCPLLAPSPATPHHVSVPARDPDPLLALAIAPAWAQAGGCFYPCRGASASGARGRAGDGRALGTAGREQAGACVERGTPALAPLSPRRPAGLWLGGRSSPQP